MERLFLECAVRAALLIGGTTIVLYALRVKDAAARHSVWAGVVVVMLLLPVWTAWGPRAALRVLPAVAERTTSISIAPPSAGAFSPAVPQADSFNMEIAAGTAQPASWNWRVAFLGIYLLGLCALLLRLAIGTLRARRLVGRATLVDGRLTSASCAVPIAVGWLRPTVILPEQWREWPQAKLDAVLTHEGEHARRRDPLVQGLALVNRAVFWFHPGAWWLERKLSALAEEACDDVVLARGHSAADYSEYLMDMARAAMHSGKRVNVAGLAMPGSSLPQRIRRIIEGGPVARISRGRMACVGAACFITCTVFAAGKLDRAQPNSATPFAAQTGGLPVGSARPAFESVSIKAETDAGLRFAIDRNGQLMIDRQTGMLTVTSSVRQMVEWAYGLIPAQDRMISGAPAPLRPLQKPVQPPPIRGAPSWVESARFQIEAKVPSGTDAGRARQWPVLDLMFRSLLADRFKLAVHYETDIVPVYALEMSEAGRLGPQLRRHLDDGSCWSAADDQSRWGVTGVPTRIPFCPGVRMSMAQVATYLTGLVDRPVVDRTGLSGAFDVDLEIEREPSTDLSPLFVALREQLGLRLVPTNGPIQVLVIDHVERPTADETAQAQAGPSGNAVPVQTRPVAAAAQSSAVAPTLQPFSRLPIRITANNSSKELFEAVARQAGLTVMFDSSFTSRRITIDLASVTVEKAFDAIALEAGASWQRVTGTSIYVAPAQTTPSAGRPEFDSVSINVNDGVLSQRWIQWDRQQPGLLKLRGSNATLRELIAMAYPLNAAQGRMISGVPDRFNAHPTGQELIPGAPIWMDSVYLDIEARVQESQSQELPIGGKGIRFLTPNAEQRRLMLQSLLADRFKLVVHYEAEVVPVYALELFEAGRLGPHLRGHVSDGSCWDPAADQSQIPGQPLLPYCGGFRIAGPNNTIPENRRNVSMERLAAFLTGIVDRPVLNRTGLSGAFDFDLVRDRRPTADLSPLFLAVREQLGLRLVPTNGPIEILVIDHVERPSEGSFAGQRAAAR